MLLMDVFSYLSSLRLSISARRPAVRTEIFLSPSWQILRQYVEVELSFTATQIPNSVSLQFEFVWQV